jgi:hypothetical protein
MLFHHLSKYYVCFKSACSNTGSRTPPSSGTTALKGHKKPSFMKGCSCADKCKSLDDILKGPNGHVWAQAVERRLGVAQTLVVNKDTFMWFPIKAPLEKTPSQNQKQRKGGERIAERRRSLQELRDSKSKVRWNLDINLPKSASIPENMECEDDTEGAGEEHK